MANTAPTYAEFIAAYPGLAGVEQTSAELALNFSGRLLNARSWGDFYSDAVGLDAAHNLVLQQKATANPMGADVTAGPMTSASVGGISASFSQPHWNDKSAVDQWYMKTVYGQQFLRLRDVCQPCGYLAS